uniref:Uncharacterized protein n=1 Tax=Branchiostoma floridae TaxID=7739 RepID=C3ZZ78_BRAFL|eukprot:XP_002586127.1 hypothetical protein BRAFLDRAFT_105914 [Branchiostoma floridae]
MEQGRLAKSGQYKEIISALTAPLLVGCFPLIGTVINQAEQVLLTTLRPPQIASAAPTRLTTRPLYPQPARSTPNPPAVPPTRPQCPQPACSTPNPPAVPPTRPQYPQPARSTPDPPAVPSPTHHTEAATDRQCRPHTAHNTPVVSHSRWRGTALQKVGGEKEKNRNKVRNLLPTWIQESLGYTVNIAVWYKATD